MKQLLIPLDSEKIDDSLGTAFHYLLDYLTLPENKKKYLNFEKQALGKLFDKGIEIDKEISLDECLKLTYVQYLGRTFRFARLCCVRKRRQAFVK